MDRAALDRARRACLTAATALTALLCLLPMVVVLAAMSQGRYVGLSQLCIAQLVIASALGGAFAVAAVWYARS